MPENIYDMRSRLEQMVKPHSKWDLSPNDVAAIRWALATIDELLASCKSMRATMHSPRSDESKQADAAIANATGC